MKDPSLIPSTYCQFRLNITSLYFLLVHQSLPPLSSLSHTLSLSLSLSASLVSHSLFSLPILFRPRSTCSLTLPRCGCGVDPPFLFVPSSHSSLFVFSQSTIFSLYPLPFTASAYLSYNLPVFLSVRPLLPPPWISLSFSLCVCSSGHLFNSLSSLHLVISERREERKREGRRKRRKLSHLHLLIFSLIQLNWPMREKKIACDRHQDTNFYCNAFQFIENLLILIMGC